LGKGVATLAVVDMLGGVQQGTGQGLGRRTIVLQQVKRHALGRFNSHAGQAAQRLNQSV
jgi:hypothetical protein